MRKTYKRKSTTRKEEDAHATICKYVRLIYPDVIFTSDGSGLRLPMGLAKKYSGLKSGRGIPDLLILEPNNTYRGLMLEIKREGTRVFLKDGSLSIDKHIREQAVVLDRLHKKGYAAYFCIGAKQGIEYVDKYMNNIDF